MLALTGSLDTASLRFQPLLSAQQLGCIRYYGKHVMQTPDGYIAPWRGTVLTIN